MELIKEIERLKTENEQLKKELNDTKEHLKKYTAPSRSKTYYENHKEEIKHRENLKKRYGDEEYKKLRAKEIAEYRKSSR